MSAPGPILRELHRLLKFAKELQTRMAQAPKTLQAQQARARKQEELLHQAQDTLKKLKVVTHEKEVQIKTKRQQIAKYEKQLDEIHVTKEYNALKHEIATAQADIRQLEDKILEEMEETEQRTAALAEMDKTTKQVQAEAVAFERSTAERLTSFASQRQQALTDLAALEPTLPPEIKAQYDRSVKAKGDEALASVENRTCTACYCELTAQHYNEIKSGRTLNCQSCGRILYLSE